MDITALVWGMFVVEALVLVPLIVLLVFAIRKVSHKTDPARSGFKWYLATVGIYLGAFTLYAIAYALNIVHWYVWNAGEHLLRAIVRTETIAVLVATIGDAALLITIASIGAGIVVISTGAAPIAMKMGVKVLAVIISALALSYFVRTQYYLSEAVRRWNDMDNWIDDTRRVNSILAGVIIVFTLLGALIVLGYAIVAKVQSSRITGAALKTATTLLISAAAINMVLRGFAMWEGVERLQHNLSFTVFSTDWTIAEPIINRWGTLAMLVVLYCLGIKKEGGVWSNQGKDYPTGRV